MEVRPGYKQAEVGVIPEAWDCERIRDAAANKANAVVGGPFGSDLVSADYVEMGVPVIRGQNMSERFVSGDFVFVSPRKAMSLSANLANPGDLVFTQRGTLGQVAIVPGDIFNSYLISQSQMKVSLNRARHDPCFVYQYFASQAGQKQIANSAIQTGVPHTNLGILRAYRFPAPPIDEQRAIASALSDVDALLEGLDRLIAKKRDLKQAAMQQLLTGQARLPGFRGEWEVMRLGDHVTFLRNGVSSRAELRPEGQVKYLHYGDIHASTGSILSPQILPSLPDAKATRLDRLSDGDLIFADASEDIAGVCKSVELRDTRDTEVVSGLHTIAARFDKTVLADGFKGFLQYCPTFASHLRRHAAGTKVLATNRAHIASVEMRLPDVAEQEAIAAVLSDMDSELVALEARRDKTRALKQGMMQELLTGRIRLVESGTGAREQPESQTEGQQANIHFRRSVLAAEIIDRLHAEPTFGHVKFEKVMFLVEHLCAIDTGSTYLRKAAGPYDNRALRSIDSQLRKQQWFDCRKEGERYRYMPMAHRGGHKHYFERYFADITDTFENVLKTFKTLETERCEIVATLLSAWSDLLQTEGDVPDERIVHEVLNNWHKSKERIPKDRWLKAIGWMRSRGFVPNGGAKP